jgi:hypothetical protein
MSLNTMDVSWQELFPEAWPPPLLAISVSQRYGIVMKRMAACSRV